MHRVRLLPKHQRGQRQEPEKVDDLDLITPREVAGLFGVHRLTIHTWAYNGTLPPPIKFNGSPKGRLFWRRKVLLEWMKMKEIQPQKARKR